MLVSQSHHRGARSRVALSLAGRKVQESVYGTLSSGCIPTRLPPRRRATCSIIVFYAWPVEFVVVCGTVPTKSRQGPIMPPHPHCKPIPGAHLFKTTVPHPSHIQYCTTTLSYSCPCLKHKTEHDGLLCVSDQPHIQQWPRGWHAITIVHTGPCPCSRSLSVMSNQGRTDPSLGPQPDCTLM
jgi:hypothetical protein